MECMAIEISEFCDLHTGLVIVIAALLSRTPSFSLKEGLLIERNLTLFRDLSCHNTALLKGAVCLCSEFDLISFTSRFMQAVSECIACVS